MTSSEDSANSHRQLQQPQNSFKKEHPRKLYQSKIKAPLFRDEEDKIQIVADSPNANSQNNSSNKKDLSLNESPKNSIDVAEIYYSPYPSLMPHWSENLMESLEKKEKNLDGSPGLLIIDSGSFKKILEREDEGEENEDFNEDNEERGINRLYDVEGNTICQFDPNFYDENNPNFENDIGEVIQDKENDELYMQNLQTPLKNKQLRSPLKDITPSITKRKKKSSALRTVSYKNQNFLTPRTMAESRFAGSSSLRRIQRL